MKVLLLLACSSVAWAQSSFSGAGAIDDAINASVEKQTIPGAVVELSLIHI